jgi:hypothetical protein
MRDVIGAGVGVRFERHRARHVSRHRHPVFMRPTNDCAGDIGLEECVELHLLKPGRVVRVDDTASLFWRVSIHGSEGAVAAAVDQAGEQQARAKHAATSKCVAKRDEKLFLSAHVARRCDTDAK